MKSAMRHPFLVLIVAAVWCSGGAAFADRKEKPKPETVYGRIQYVTTFPDVKVRVVRSFADLRVQVVTSFANKPGRWQIVDHLPDFRVQIVEHFEDFTIE